MIIHNSIIEGTTSGGELTDNTKSIMGVCYHVMVKPETETTVYNISITNSNDIKMYERLSETGTLSELVTMPMRGISTVSISSATADEDFVIQLSLQE